MPQQKINQFFSSSSNLPPKKRKREEELSSEVDVDMNENKKIKVTARSTSSHGTKKKRKLDTEQSVTEKKIRREDARIKMETEVDKPNDEYNQMAPRDENEGELAERISIETINVNSFIEMSRLTRVKTMVKYWENDVTVLVDTRIRRNKAGLLNTEGNKIFSTDKPFRGVAIKVNRRLEPEEVDVDEKNANYVTIIINVGGKKIGLIGIYAPNNDDASFFREEIANQMAKLVTKTDEQIITGDFNVNLSKGIGYAKRKSYKSEALRNLIKTWDFKDPIEVKALKNKKYPVTNIHTTRNESENKNIYPLKAARLDGLFTTMDDIKCEVKIGRFYLSDHAPVRMDLKIMKEIGKKIWKLNAKLLENERVVDKWKKIARRLTDANETLEEKLESEINITAFRRREVLGKDAQKRWSRLIKIVKADSIEEGKKAAAERKLKEGNLLSRAEMMNLEKDEIDELFDDLNREETEKNKIRSELKNYKLNNTNKRLVKRKAKMEEQSRRIYKIQIGDETTTDPDKIKENIQRYFKYQFRCECKNKWNPRPCKICKNKPSRIRKNDGEEFQEAITQPKKDQLFTQVQVGTGPNETRIG